MQYNMDMSGCEIFVGNLDEHVTEDMLFAFFHAFGKILHIKVYRHIITKRPLGYAFIMFSRPQEALKAKAKAHRTQFLKQRLRVCLVNEYYALDKNANLVIRRLKGDVNEEKIEEVCEKFGPVFSVKVVDEDGQRKAYVQFQSLVDSKKCLDGLKEVQGSPVSVEQASRKTLAIVKGNLAVDAQKRVKALVPNCAVVNFETDEKSLAFLATVRFESEEELAAFLKDFAANRDKCELIRRPDKGGRRLLTKART